MHVLHCIAVIIFLPLISSSAISAAAVDESLNQLLATTSAANALGSVREKWYQLQDTLNKHHMHLGYFATDFYRQENVDEEVDSSSSSAAANNLQEETIRAMLRRLLPLTRRIALLDRIATEYELLVDDNDEELDRNALVLHCMKELARMLMKSTYFRNPVVGRWFQVNHLDKAPFGLEWRLIRELSVTILLIYAHQPVMDNPIHAFQFAIASMCKNTDLEMYLFMVSHITRTDLEVTRQVHQKSLELGISSMAETVHYWLKWMQWRDCGLSLDQEAYVWRNQHNNYYHYEHNINTHILLMTPFMTFENWWQYRFAIIMTRISELYHRRMHVIGHMSARRFRPFLEHRYLLDVGDLRYPIESNFRGIFPGSNLTSISVMKVQLLIARLSRARMQREVQAGAYGPLARWLADHQLLDINHKLAVAEQFQLFLLYHHCQQRLQLFYHSHNLSVVIPFRDELRCESILQSDEFWSVRINRQDALGYYLFQLWLFVRHQSLLKHKLASSGEIIHTLKTLMFDCEPQNLIDNMFGVVELFTTILSPRLKCDASISFHYMWLCVWRIAQICHQQHEQIEATRIQSRTRRRMVSQMLSSCLRRCQIAAAGGLVQAEAQVRQHPVTDNVVTFDSTGMQSGDQTSHRPRMSFVMSRLYGQFCNLQRYHQMQQINRERNVSEAAVDPRDACSSKFVKVSKVIEECQSDIFQGSMQFEDGSLPPLTLSNHANGTCDAIEGSLFLAAVGVAFATPSASNWTSRLRYLGLLSGECLDWINFCVIMNVNFDDRRLVAGMIYWLLSFHIQCNLNRDSMMSAMHSTPPRTVNSYTNVSYMTTHELVLLVDDACLFDETNRLEWMIELHQFLNRIVDEGKVSWYVVLEVYLALYELKKARLLDPSTDSLALVRNPVDAILVHLYRRVTRGNLVELVQLLQMLHLAPRFVEAMQTLDPYEDEMEFVDGVRSKCDGFGAVATVLEAHAVHVDPIYPSVSCIIQ